MKDGGVEEDVVGGIRDPCRRSEAPMGILWMLNREDREGVEEC